MILRRFMKHVTDQNWFAVGLDVIVVIAGVYIGVYLGEISSERATQKDVDEAVSVIEGQLRADLANIDRIIDYRIEKLEQPRKAVALLMAREFDKVQLSDSLFNTYRRNFTFFPNTSGYSGVKDLGNLAKIDQTELKLALADIYDRIYERHIVISTESDTNIWGYDKDVIQVYWSPADNSYIGDDEIARKRLLNAVTSALTNGEWYVEFLTKTVRPSVAKGIKAIEAYQRVNESDAAI